MSSPSRPAQPLTWGFSRGVENIVKRQCRGAAWRDQGAETSTAHRLTIGLQHWRAADAVLVKLVDQYNVSWGTVDEGYEEEVDEPDHIDVGHVTFKGAHIALPDGLTLSF